MSTEPLPASQMKAIDSQGEHHALGVELKHDRTVDEPAGLTDEEKKLVRKIVWKTDLRMFVCLCGMYLMVRAKS